MSCEITIDEFLDKVHSQVVNQYRAYLRVFRTPDQVRVKKNDRPR